MTEPKIKLPPTIPASCKKIFESKIEHLPPEKISVLRGQIDRYLKTIKSKAPENKYLDMKLIEKMAKTLDTLLSCYTELSEEHRSLVVGAARYFIETSDAKEDLTDPLGFDDDLAVINTVVLIIDRTDLVITRSS